ncbi:MAG: TonB-dependent receptor [Proteobacteria bacterium]|nr:TonB-dependent receptor [Pseudomonadota bacterium]
MTPIRNLLSDAVRYGLAAGAVGFAGLASMSAFAQDTTAPKPDETKAKEVGRVEVIGSRIKRSVDTEPTAPVTVMTKADIQQTGLTSTFDVLNHITASDGTGLSTVTTQTNGSDGSTSVSLRNLGANRTLVLVDGKRWVTDITGTVDLSSIPVAIIERVEVLKDGASTIYGSDAIAGVINIITRRKFEGAQAGWSYGQTSHGDGAQESEDVTIGANGEHSNAVVSLSRSKQTAIYFANRTRTQFPFFGCASLLSHWPASDPNSLASSCGSSSGQFGRIGIRWNGSLGPNPGIFGFGGSVALNNSFNDQGSQTANPANATATAPGTKITDFHVFDPLDRYNYAPINYLQQPAVRNNLFASGRFDITDNIQAYARVSYTQRQSSQQLAQVPDGLNRASFGAPWQFNVDPNDIFNPFTAAGYTVTNVRLRNVAIGPRHNTYDFNTLGSTVGLQGSFTLGERSFDWEVYAQYNSEHDSLVGSNYVNLFNLKTAIGPSFADANGLHCGTYNPLAPNNGAIAGCTPFNLFSGPTLGVGNKYKTADGSGPGGYYTVTAADVQAMINYVRYTLTSSDGNKDYNYGATISGEIVPLQGGMLQFAAGAEQRRSTSFQQPDALVAGGGSSTNFQQPSSGGTKQTDVYLEIDAPLLKNLPGAKELEIDAAVRHSSITAQGNFGQQLGNGTILPQVHLNENIGSPTNKKFSLRWKPVDDLLVRSSWGDTFRSPSVFDLFSGVSQNFPIALDPCNARQFSALPAAGQARCLAAGIPPGGINDPSQYFGSQLSGTTGGNPLLKPEHGHDFTAGLVWSPSWDVLKGLNVTVDYWRINLKDAIVANGAQTTLNNCYKLNQADSCAQIVRLPNGNLFNVASTEFNATSFKTDGFDFGATYSYETSSWGRFGVKLDSTYTRHASTDGANGVGFYNGGPSWKWRTNMTLDWTRGDWDASWTMRYTSALIENVGCSTKVDTGINTPFGFLPEATNAGANAIICNHPNSTYINDTFNPSVGSALGVGGRLLGYNRIGGTVFHDVQVGWKAPWKAHLSVGARNVFGKEPPLIASSFAGSFDAAYDLPGGPFYYFQYRQDF